VSSLQWQADSIPGLLQTEDYARQLSAAYQSVVPTTPPSVIDRFVRSRMIRQERLTHEPVLQLSVVLDEAVLLRRIGGRGVMRAQLEHLADMADLPNVDLRVMPLDRELALLAGSFVIMSFGSSSTAEAASLSDVVSTESLNTELHVEGETDTQVYRLFFQALTSPGDGRHGVKAHAYRPDTLYEVVLRDGGTTGFTKPEGRYLRLCRTVVRLGTPFRSALTKASLPPAESRDLIFTTIERAWS
jgi:hypothetical protein